MLKEFVYDKSKTYIVGVSGGPDSMALLDMLYKQNYILVVCLVNYNTREESENEQKEVEKYCRSRGITFETINVLYYKKYGNFEAWAREVRYTFFKETAKRHSAEGVFIAHHQGDKLETYLMQKKRRIITKYYGLKEETLLMGMKVYRPLLDYRKEELINYCVKNNLFYSIDYTNLENDHLRNKIRNEILSKYEKKQIDELLLKIETDNQKRSKNLEKVKKYENLDKIEISSFLSLDEIEQQLVIHQLIVNKVPEAINKLSWFRINEFIKLLSSDKPNVFLKVYGSYYFIREYNFFYVDKIEEDKGYSYLMEEPSSLDTLYFSCDMNLDTSFLKITRESYPLTFRNVRVGDEVFIGDKKKKVNRLLIDEKVPLSKRKKYPVVVDNKGKIVYIPLYRSEIQKKIANKLKFMLK